MNYGRWFKAQGADFLRRLEWGNQRGVEMTEASFAEVRRRRSWPRRDLFAPCFGERQPIEFELSKIRHVTTYRNLS